MKKLESSRPKPGGMEKTPKGGRGPPWAVALLERENCSAHGLGIRLLIAPT